MLKKNSYQQDISNNAFRWLNLRPQLMKVIKKNRYFGHIPTGENYEHKDLSLEGTVTGKRRQERPRKA